MTPSFLFSILHETKLYLRTYDPLTSLFKSIREYKEGKIR